MDGINDGRAGVGMGVGAGLRKHGRYSILKSLGRGGMGEVFKAIDSTSNRHVAIKVLDPEAYKDRETLKRFEREARSAMSLDHGNIARMYGMEYDDENHPFIVMEYIEGEPLDRFAKGGVEMPFSRLTDFVIQAARGLEAAHRRSIIHRDIKPTNVLVTNDFVVKIIDFGLAKSMWEKSFVTATGMVVGTPRYIPPEQALGRTVDHRSDIYSLGATFYELVTHQCPFDGDTAMAIMLKHINTPLVPPYMINPKVPGDINEIICKMMAKDPGERYQDYEPLIRDLESAKLHRLAKERRVASHDSPGGGATPMELDGGDEFVTISPSGPPSYLTEGLIKVSMKDLPELPPPSRARMYILTVIGLFVVVLAVAGLLQARRSAERGEPSWVALKIRELMGPQKKSEPVSVGDIVRDDAERISTTRQRMEAMVVKVLDYKRSANSSSIPTVRQLRKSNAVTVEESRDAWGTPLITSTERGGVVISLGRDGREGTDDDFVLSLTGAALKIPSQISLSDAAIQKQLREDDQAR